MPNGALAVIEAAPESTALTTYVAHNPVAVLTSADKFDALLADIQAEVAAFKPDTSTAKGRAAIRSLSHKVTQTKTAIDDSRTRLTAEWREKTKAVNKAGSVIWDRLEALAIEARRPLAEWEAEQERRLMRRRAVIDAIEAAAMPRVGDTSEDAAARLEYVRGEEITEAEFQDLYPAATTARDSAVHALLTTCASLHQREAERAELARLRAEAAERERIEAARLAAEQAERDRLAAEQAEQARKDAEAADAARIAQAAADAAHRAAEEAAAAELARVEAAYQTQLRAAEEATKAAEAAAAEVKRQAEEAERQRYAEEARRQREAAAAEAAARERAANERLRRACMTQAKEAMMREAAITDEAARAVVLAIVRGQIPHMQVVW